MFLVYNLQRLHMTVLFLLIRKGAEQLDTRKQLGNVTMFETRLISFDKAVLPVRNKSKSSNTKTNKRNIDCKDDMR